MNTTNKQTKEDERWDIFVQILALPYIVFINFPELFVIFMAFYMVGVGGISYLFSLILFSLPFYFPLVIGYFSVNALCAYIHYHFTRP